MKKEIFATVYTIEGKKELIFTEWSDFDDSKLYREGDLPNVEYTSGVKRWYKNRMLHRETGPASVWYCGVGFYYLGGKHHSEETFHEKLREIDYLPLSLALTHEEEWVRDRAKRRSE